jgi:hypothetical protein
MLNIILTLLGKVAPTLFKFFAKGASAASSLFNFQFNISKHYHYHGDEYENG